MLQINSKSFFLRNKGSVCLKSSCWNPRSSCGFLFACVHATHLSALRRKSMLQISSKNLIYETRDRCAWNPLAKIPEVLVVFGLLVSTQLTCLLQISSRILFCETADLSAQDYLHLLTACWLFWTIPRLFTSCQQTRLVVLNGYNSALRFSSVIQNCCVLPVGKHLLYWLLSASWNSRMVDNMRGICWTQMVLWLHDEQTACE